MPGIVQGDLHCLYVRLDKGSIRGQMKKALILLHINPDDLVPLSTFLPQDEQIRKTLL
jgi:hypothetical protein